MKWSTAVRLPKKWAGAKFYFEKVTDRATWDFALVNVASAMHHRRRHDQGRAHRLRRGRVRAAAPESRRAGRDRPAAERRHRADRAAALPARAPRAVQYNGYKIPLMENLVRRAVRDS